jgi:hypothetical protein
MCDSPGLFPELRASTGLIKEAGAGLIKEAGAGLIKEAGADLGEKSGAGFNYYIMCSFVIKICETSLVFAFFFARSFVVVRA